MTGDLARSRIDLSPEGDDMPEPIVEAREIHKTYRTGSMELPVLKGMRDLLRRDRPILIVEDNSVEASIFLEQLGYSTRKLARSSNRIFSMAPLDDLPA